ncbi:unnamed protein product [Urochloa decumbens]|uniref:DUF4220 domain-containing protein n=1 Tax=Urochloa decumbens TaxID=240449 RepID=A0ABC9BG86_9POAL
MANNTHTNGTSKTLSQGVIDWWNSPRGTVIHIEVLVVLAATILLFLATFGSQRRRSRNFFIQKGVLGAYALSSSLVSYTLGSMQSARTKSNLYSVWAISLYVLSSCSDSITACSIDDHNRYMGQTYLFCLYHVYVSMIIRSSGLDIFPALYLCTVASQKLVHRLLVPKLATESWNLNKTIADYMYKEHIKRGSSYNPATMQGYHYLVDWPLQMSTLRAGTSYTTLLTANASQVIDIERIWLCSGRSLSPELKDECLSFSLFHLLRRRFFGFQCGESSHQKTHDFVFKGLLSKSVDGSTDYNRVFKVIDVELAFMYDFFFTKYAVLYYGSRSSTFWSLASASLISITAFLTVKLPVTMSSKPDKLVLDSTTAHATIFFTVLILASVALLELLQLLLYWTTIWGRVSFACHYVREQAVNTRGSYCMRFKEILTKISVFASNKCYYQDKLGQYSLVESVNYDPSPYLAGVDVPIRRRYQRFFNLLDPSAFDHNMQEYALSVRKRHGKPIKLPAEVKAALVQSLERTEGKLTNGESSLLSNGAPNLLWACRHDMHSDLSTSQGTENQACFILTWHVATCYCEMATLKCLSPKAGGELKFNFDVATILSKYCTHLVASVPKLLPGHHYDTSRVFDAVAAEAAQFLPGNKFEAMRSLPESTQMSVFPMGVKLGKQLEEMEEGTRWKVLADFSAEKMLYVAPSDNVKEHIERLAYGGEFITHLWALLTHAGILERAQRNAMDIENAGTGQPYPGEGLCSAALRFRRASSCPLTSEDKQAAPATCII